MGEAAKASDYIPVPAGEIGGAGIGELLKERQRRFLHRQVFAVHQRHQPELPPRLLRFRLQPAQLHRLQAQRQGLWVASESHGGVAPDVPRETIEQPILGQGSGRRLGPGTDLSGDGRVREPPEAIPHHAIEGRILGETLAQTAFLALEEQNRLQAIGPAARDRVGLVHPSSARRWPPFSRVCSISVRVLILEVV